MAIAVVAVVAVVLALIVGVVYFAHDDGHPSSGTDEGALPTASSAPGGRPAALPTTVAPSTDPATSAPAAESTVASTAPATTSVSTSLTTTPPTTSAPTTTPPTTSVAPSTTAPTTTTTTTTTAPPPTTTVAPPLAPAPDAGAALSPTAAPPDGAIVLAPADTSPETMAALENTRAVAAALAAGDWAAARELGPTDRGRTDAQLEAAYGPVTDATLIPARVTRSGQWIDLRLGLVAHEDHDTGPATAVMCVHWRVNDATRAVERISSARLRLEQGTVDPATLVDELSATCATYPLR